MTGIERLDLIVKNFSSMEIDGTKVLTKRISEKKLKIWTEHSFSPVWWLRARDNAIGVYVAGYLEMKQEDMLNIVKRAKDLKTINIVKGPDFNVEEFFEEFRWWINKTIHEFKWSTEYPYRMECWRPLAQDSLRNVSDDIDFIQLVKTDIRIRAKRIRR